MWLKECIYALIYLYNDHSLTKNSKKDIVHVTHLSLFACSCSQLWLIGLIMSIRRNKGVLSQRAQNHVTDLPMHLPG